MNTKSYALPTADRGKKHAMTRTSVDIPPSNSWLTLSSIARARQTRHEMAALNGLTCAVAPRATVGKD